MPAQPITCISRSAYAQFLETAKRLFDSRGFAISRVVDEDRQADLACDTPRYGLRMEGTRSDARGVHLASLYVCMAPKTVGVSSLRPVIAEAEEAQHGMGAVTHTVLCVSHHAPTAFAKKVVGERQAEAPDARVELWTFSQLAFPVVDHVLQPVFRVLEDDQAAVLRHQGTLPVMLASDPVARWFGLDPGRVLQCDRALPSGGVLRYFRRIA